MPWPIEGSELEAHAEDANYGEDDHEVPAGGFPEAMADGEEDCDCERREVEYQEEDRHGIAVVDCH